MQSSRFDMMFVAAALFLAACAPGDPGNGGNNGDDDSSAHPDADPNSGFIDAAPFIDAGGFYDGGGQQQNGACDKIDILFVIDNSGSMEEEQANLATNFPAFVDVIENYVTSGGDHLDYHLAITTTDRNFTENDTIPPIPFPIPTGHSGNDGKFQVGNGCGFPSGRRYLQKGDANVRTAFSCAAKVGTGGDSSEMPLEAAKLSLVDRIQDGYNSGFLREDALLAVVMLTDENDCSVSGDPVEVSGVDICQLANPVAPYLTAFDALKGGERGRWAAAVIAGPGPGSCTSSFGSAEEATRLKDFTNAVGQNAVFSSICAGDLSSSLHDAFETFGIACENIPPVN